MKKSNENFKKGLLKNPMLISQEIIKQGNSNDNPVAISYDSTEIILEQMKKSICKIKSSKDQGSGFFCKIPFPDKGNMLNVLITNYHIIDKQLLEGEEKFQIIIKEKKEIIELNLNLDNRFTYFSEKYDTTII